jgi:perosamine synthetase
MDIPLSRPLIDDQEINAVIEVLKSGWYAHGPKNHEFEAAFAEYIGVDHAISVNSCASALHLAILAQEITGEIILPSFTYVASANAVITAGATPIFADIDIRTGNIDPDHIEALITPNTEAIMPVHYAGQACNMDRIMDIAARHGLAIIEDSAETVGGTYKGKKAGSFETGCFSFFPTKNVTTGEGGMLTTNDEILAQKARAIAAHGISSSTFARQKKERPWLRAATFAGYNFRMSNILAALGVEQMKKLEGMNAARRSHAAYLNERLSDLDGIITPHEDQDCRHVYQMYTVRTNGISRDRFLMRLRDQGIEASVHFDPPVHLQPYYEELTASTPLHLPRTEELSATIVTLPMYPHITKAELDQVSKTIKRTVFELKIDLDPNGVPTTLSAVS